MTKSKSDPTTTPVSRASKAPPPIDPLRRQSLALPSSKPLALADWGRWSYMREVELWEAVALTLNLEPDGMPVYMKAYELHGDDPFRICPKSFLDRLQLANSNAGITLPVKIVHPLRARSLVDLPMFARWAAGPWTDLPLVARRSS